jgi:hypothetical protein
MIFEVLKAGRMKPIVPVLAIKATGGIKVWLHSFLTSALTNFMSLAS